MMEKLSKVVMGHSILQFLDVKACAGNTGNSSGVTTAETLQFLDPDFTAQFTAS